MLSTEQRWVALSRGEAEGWASFWLRPGVILWSSNSSQPCSSSGFLSTWKKMEEKITGIAFISGKLSLNGLWVTKWWRIKYGSTRKQKARPWVGKGKPVYGCALWPVKIGKSRWGTNGGHHHAARLFWRLREALLQSRPSSGTLFWGNGKWKQFKEMKSEKKNLASKNLRRSHPPSLFKLLRHNYKDWKLTERLFKKCGFVSVELHGLFGWWSFGEKLRLKNLNVKERTL